MNQVLAEKIIREVKKFSSHRYAITDDLGIVLAKTKDFSINHTQLDIKGKKAIDLYHQGSICGYIYIDEPPKVITELGFIIKSMAELIIQQDRYTRMLTRDEKKIDQIAYDFFFSNNSESSQAIKVLKSFGINLIKKRVAVLIEISDSDYLKHNEKEALEGDREKIIARTKRGLERTLDSFYTQHKDNLVFYIGGRNFLVLKDMGDNAHEYQEEFKKTLNNLIYNLKTELVTGVTIGVGKYKPGLEGLRESFSESRTALQFGKQIWGNNKIFHYDNFGVIAPLFSGANSDNISFSKEIITKVKKNKELHQTLVTYFKHDLSVTKTAKTLHIHRNTLVYRLEKIEELTDLDPRIFEEAFQLYMALILDKYHG
ncbi:helix-turn-helix domain-containing protein [Patescibacteria group bacterium]|nr:helix-turn-helix domain-containing protein [Patescibacteria group bacterium]